MLVTNEKFELLDSSDYAKLFSIDSISKIDVTEEEAESALAEMFTGPSFIEADFLDQSNFKSQSSFIQVKRIQPKKILQKVKEYFCKLAKADTVVSELIKIIIEAIASVVPLGKLIKGAVEKIIAYFIKRGVAKVCPV